MPTTSKLSRREMIRNSVAVAALAMLERPLSSFGFDAPASATTPIPFVEPQAKGSGIRWDDLQDWITPSKQLFGVQHYDVPKAMPDPYRLDISGLVKDPKTLSLEAIQSRKRKTITATLECSGNGSSPGFMGAIGNVKWTGTPLAPLLKDCGIKARAKEVVF